MPSATPLPPPHRDRRGNRLVEWTPQPAGPGHHLWLRTTADVVDQIRRVAGDYRRIDPPAHYQGGWTHLLHSPRPLQSEVEDLLDLLTSVLILPPPRGVTTALALDWYKLPEDGVDPRSWSNTAAGEWINRGKYWYRSSREQQVEIGRRATAALSDAVRRHPGLAATTVVVDVPGHDAAQVSFGSQLAASVARATGKPFRRVSCTARFRAEAKSVTDAQHAAALRGLFEVPEPLPGADVLVVDDVFRSGRSMAEVARACRAAGAASVSGLCVARTLRS